MRGKDLKATVIANQKTLEAKPNPLAQYGVACWASLLSGWGRDLSSWVRCAGVGQLRAAVVVESASHQYTRYPKFVPMPELMRRKVHWTGSGKKMKDR